MKTVVMALALTLITPLALPVAANPTATQLVNSIRAGQGQAAVRYSRRLELAAKAHADDMARRGFFSHRGSNGTTVGKRVRRAGYRFCFAAENIAYGQRSLNAAIKAWAVSPGHYRNMVNRQAREFAVAKGPGNYWVMVLARRC